MLSTATLPELQSSAPCLAIVPIGSFEQHGAHLPYTTDTWIAGLLAQALAERLGALLVSPLTISCSHEHAGFPYAVSVRAKTLAAMVEDIVASLELSGIRLTILLNAHGGNYVLGNVAQELNQTKPRVLMLPTRQHWTEACLAAGIESTVSQDMHGGEIETSLLLHAVPEVVRAANLRQDHDAPQRPWLTLKGMRHYAPAGIIGFPQRASAAKGARLLAALSEGMAADIQELLPTL